MALPSNVDHGTVVGYFEDVIGNALAGTVIFTPQFTVGRDVTATPKTIILPASVTATLTQGAFSVLLVATDDTDLGLSTWNYLVTPKFTGPNTGSNAPSMLPFNVNVPMNTTTDLADVVTVASATGVQITKGDKGDPGDPGVMQTVVAGTANVSIDATDSANPIISVSGTGGTPGGTGDLLLATDTQSEAWGVLGTVPTANLPALAINDTFTVADLTARLALTAQRGDMAFQTDTSTWYILATDAPATDANWKAISVPAVVQSVNAKTGAVVLVASDVGAVPTTRTVAGQALSADVTAATLKTALAVDQVTNTSDANKPVSTAQQAALDGKLPIETGAPVGRFRGFVTAEPPSLVTGDWWWLIG